MICSRPEVCIQEKDEEWKLEKTNGRHASSVHRLSGDIRHQQQVHLRQKDRDSKQQQNDVKEDNQAQGKEKILRQSKDIQDSQRHEVLLRLVEDKDSEDEVRQAVSCSGRIYSRNIDTDKSRPPQ